MSRARCEVCQETSDLYRCPEPKNRIDLMYWCGIHLVAHLMDAHAYPRAKAVEYVKTRKKINSGEP